MNAEFTNLSKLLGSYFHQDCFDYAPTVEGILIRYKQDESPEVVHQTSVETEQLLQQKLPEDSLLRFISERGCAFDPRVDFGSCGEWLSYLKLLLDEEGADRQSPRDSGQR